MSYPQQPQYPGQQPGYPPQQYPQQGPPPQQYPPQQAGPPAPGGYGPPQQAGGYGPPAPPQGYDQGYGAVAEPNWQSMADIADTSTGGDYEIGWWPAHAVQCEYGLTRKQDKYAWTPVFQFDGGPNNGRKMTTTLAISERKNDGTENPGGTAKLYRQVGAMGVPVGDKFDQPGVTPFWHLGWSGEQVAGFIAQTGAPVEIQVYWDKDWNNYKIGGIRKIRTGPGAPPMAVPAPQQAGPPAPGMQGPPPGPPAYQQGPPPQGAPQQVPYPPQQAPAPVQGPPQYAQPQAGPAPAQGPPPGWQPAQAAPPQQAQYPGQPGVGQFSPEGQGWQPGMAPPQQAQPQAGPPQQVPGPMPGNGYPQQQQPGMPQQGPPQQGGVPGPPWKQ